MRGRAAEVLCFVCVCGLIIHARSVVNRESKQQDAYIPQLHFPTFVSTLHNQQEGWRDGIELGHLPAHSVSATLRLLLDIMRVACR